jgi:Tfp pilus assembly protein PilE
VSWGGFALIEVVVTVGIVGMLCAIAYPSLNRTRAVAQKSVCGQNLQKIEWAKQQWAWESKAEARVEPAKTDLLSYLKSWPVCPVGGVYEIGPIESRPRCVIIHAEP